MKITAIDPSETYLLAHLQPEGWPDIIPQFEFYTQSEFCFPVKATIGEAVAGVGATIVHDDVAWLGHIIVDPDHRCKGLGGSITRTLIDTAHRHGCSTLYLIATAMGEPVYRKAGFVSETEYLVYKNVNRPETDAGAPIRPYRPEYTAHFAALDRTVSGENRMMHIGTHPEGAQVYCPEDIPEGYYLPALGEGLILAETPRAGIGLLRLHLQEHSNVTVPRENTAAQEFLQQTGFAEMKAIKRMRLGKERSLQLGKLYNRIGGNIG